MYRDKNVQRYYNRIESKLIALKLFARYLRIANICEK